MEKARFSFKGIKNWPKVERPRERLLKHGEQYLTDSELLAILLRTGTRGESALDLARIILRKFVDFRGMIHRDYRSWREIKGVGDAKIAQIKAAIEIGKRLSLMESNGKIKIGNGGDVFNFLKSELRGAKKEKFLVVLLNSKNYVIRTIEVTDGSVSEVRPFIREVISRTLEYFADRLICVHNHPSGDPSPSPEDRALTNDLIRAADCVEVKLLDHVIIADDGYFSFNENGEMGNGQKRE
ncbi:MAG: DNA repair protein RadC [Candidatus Omnitrophica bacterium]|nr:DNA repair protein RadC [Candidatus Omnitrophota bacterium]